MQPTPVDRCQALHPNHWIYILQISEYANVSSCNSPHDVQTQQCITLLGTHFLMICVSESAIFQLLLPLLYAMTFCNILLNSLIQRDYDYQAPVTQHYLAVHHSHFTLPIIIQNSLCASNFQRTPKQQQNSYNIDITMSVVQQLHRQLLSYFPSHFSAHSSA